MEQAGVQLVAQGASAYIGDLRDAERATNSFVDSTDKGGGRISGAGQVMIGALRQVGVVAVEAFASAAKATAAFIGDSISLAGDFESGMLNFQAVAGRDVDTQGLEDFRDLFIDIGKRLPVSTSEVQQAATELVKGGIDPATVAAGGLESSIKFAAAAMDGDLVGAAEISAKIVGGWAEVTDTAAQRSELLAHAQDTLTRAANASTVGVEDLSLGLFNVQGNAKLAGIGLDETVQALSLIAPNFSSAATAGTSLNAMIARLQPSTIPAQDAMEGLGLWTERTGSAFYDSQGAFIGWSAASQLLQDKTKGLTDAQKQSLFQTIFGMDAMGAAAELTRQGAAGWDQMTAALAKANGVQENAALKQQGFNTALDNMKGSVEALQITIGSALLPILAELLTNYISPAINAISDVADAFFDAGGMSSEFGESIGALATALGLPGEMVQDLVFVLQDLISYFQAVIEDGDTLNDFFADLPSSIQPVVMVIGNLITFFQDTSSASDALGSALADLGGIWDRLLVVVGNVMDGYMAIAQAVLPIVQGFIAEHGDEIGAFFKKAWDSIVQIVTLALDIYNTIVPPVLNAIAGFISDHGSEIGKILGGAWDVISSLITGVLETIKGVLSLALNVMRGDWSAAWEDVKNIGKAQWDAISGIITGALDIIAGLFDTSLADILQTWEDNWNAMVSLVENVGWWDAGKMVVDGLRQGINDAWDSLLRWFNEKVAGLIDAAMDAVDADSPAKEFIPVGQFIVQGIMQGLSDTWPALTDQVGSLADDLIDDMRDIGEQIQGAIADSFGATASIDRQIAKNLDRFKDVLPEYASFTQGALKQVQDEASAFLDPAEGARYFKMRSDQILEYAKLQKELSEAESADDRHRIEQQMLLINRAQQAEISQFNANMAGSQNLVESLWDQVNAIMAAIGGGTDLSDEEIAMQGILAGVLNQLQTPINPRQQAYVNPPMMQYPSGGQTTTTNSMNVNMPIYTNNTPAALQQSWQVLQASMP